MRALALLSLLFVASCGDGTAENKAAEAPDAPAAGQWALSSQVTNFHNTDHGRAAIDTPVGTRATQNVCVAADGRLPTELFSGDGYTCSYGSYYVRRGHANVSITCHRQGLRGDILMTVDGTFDGATLNLHRNLRTILSGDGDVELDADITGRRSGACTPATASEGQNRQ